MEREREREKDDWILTFEKNMWVGYVFVRKNMWLGYVFVRIGYGVGEVVNGG